MSMPPLIKKQTIVLDSLPEDEAELAALKEKLRNGAFLYIKGGTGGGSGNFPIATPTSPGAVQPDGTTTTVDSTGLLSALGGNLQLNSETWITESGEWVAPVTGDYDLLLIGGGCGGIYITAREQAIAGASGELHNELIRLNAGDTASIIIGIGGISRVHTSGADTDLTALGGKTSFISNGKTIEAAGGGINYTSYIDHVYISPLNTKYICYAGNIGSFKYATPAYVGRFGCGGGIHEGAVGFNARNGAIRLCYHDPAKANGPAAASSLAKSRKAARAAKPATVTTVNLYDPETGQGSVWREEDAPAQLAKGLITQEAWQAICKQKAAEAHAAWLADPDTEAERIEMLRAACEQKLSQTDKFTVPDYPITEEQRQAILAYRQAIRDLNHQDGAPWDGGGGLTPWPEMPELNSSDETE